MIYLFVLPFSSKEKGPGDELLDPGLETDLTPLPPLL